MARCLLVRDDHTPVRAAFPVVDAHNHLWGGWDRLADVVRVMDACGVAVYADLTANLNLRFEGGGYRFEPSDLSLFFERCETVAPGRF